MDLYPAIDLRGGQVVRLAQGDCDRQTTYGSDPAAVAAAYEAAGEITTVARGASKWQGLQTAIATTLLMKGLKTMDRTPVLEAQRITLAARDRMRELGAPADDFYTQYLAAVDKVLAILPK